MNRTDWERYAILPKAIIESSISASAKIAYAYCDAIQGTDGRPAKGTDRCASATKMSPTTWRAATRELEKWGVLAIVQTMTEGGAHKATEYWVLTNPSRRRTDPQVPVPNDSERGGRRRKPLDPISRQNAGPCRAAGQSPLKRSASDVPQEAVGAEVPPASSNDAGLGINQVVKCTECNKLLDGKFGDCCDCPF